MYTTKPGAKKPANVPDHEPPNGYICYRCGQKGHWIQLCPTNDNPDFDNRPRVKRTTGIPRSFLKTVDKSALQQTGADGEEVKPPSGLMVNADGEFVIAEPDKASWEQFQARTKSSAAAQKAASAEDKELEEKGLLCSIDNRMFIDPMKTPCCEKTYCNDCITNALIESDFICPGCQTEGVLIDDLKPDNETSETIQAFSKERETAKVKEQSPSPSVNKSQPQSPSDKKETQQPEPTKTELPAAPEKAKSATPSDGGAKPQSPKLSKTSITSHSSTEASDTSKTTEPTTKKRPADELMENPKVPKAPKAMQRAQEAKEMQNTMHGLNPMGGMPNMMPFPMNLNAFGQPNMNIGMMGMNPMMNPMMNMTGAFNPAMMNNMFGGNFPMNGGGMGNMGFMNMNGGPMNGATNGFHNNQQQVRPNFTTPNNDDEAYFRKPVNPGRHQNRQRRVRPSDYREL